MQRTQWLQATQILVHSARAGLSREQGTLRSLNSPCRPVLLVIQSSSSPKEEKTYNLFSGIVE